MEVVHGSVETVQDQMVEQQSLGFQIVARKVEDVAQLGESYSLICSSRSKNANGYILYKRKAKGFSQDLQFQGVPMPARREGTSAMLLISAYNTQQPAVGRSRLPPACLSGM